MGTQPRLRGLTVQGNGVRAEHDLLRVEHELAQLLEEGRGVGG